MPLSVSFLHASRPFHVNGTFITIFFAIAINFSACCNISIVSRAVTSELTGPSTIIQISFVTVWIFRPDFNISDGFVVTPSTIPVEYKSFISETSAESKKNFMFFFHKL